MLPQRHPQSLAQRTHRKARPCVHSTAQSHAQRNSPVEVLQRTLSQAAALDIRPALPEEYWPAADVHCQVFSEERNGHQGTASPPSPAHAETGWNAVLAALLQALELFKRISQRVDCVLSTQGNDSIQAAGFGKTAQLVAHSSDASSAQPEAIALPNPQSSQSPAASPQPPAPLPQLLDPRVLTPLFTQWATNLVAQNVRPGVGTYASDVGMVGVATVDNFGDRVPQRALTIERHHALGQIRREGMGYICNVAVLPSARRQGVGKALMEAAERLATDWGCRSVGLHCDPKNTAAIELYSAMGYRKTKFLEDPWIPWIMGRGHAGRCVFMIKRLRPGTAAVQGEHDPGVEADSDSPDR